MPTNEKPDRSWMPRIHEVKALTRELAALERENEHLKLCLSDMADALYANNNGHDLRHGLEDLVIRWMHRYNDASLKALTAERKVSAWERNA